MNKPTSSMNGEEMIKRFTKLDLARLVEQKLGSPGLIAELGIDALPAGPLVPPAEADLATARATVAKLDAEAKELPARIAAAVRDGRDAECDRLVERAGEVPRALAKARVNLARAEHLLALCTLPELIADRNAAAVRQAEAGQVLRDAETAHVVAMNEHQGARERLTDGLARLRDLAVERRRAERLLLEGLGVKAGLGA